MRLLFCSVSGVGRYTVRTGRLCQMLHSIRLAAQYSKYHSFVFFLHAIQLPHVMSRVDTSGK